jgi:chromosome segregation ATPase
MEIVRMLEEMRTAKRALEKVLPSLEGLGQLLREKRNRLFDLSYDLKDAADSLRCTCDLYRVREYFTEHMYCAARLLMKSYEEILHFPLFAAIDELKAAMAEIEEEISKLEKEYERLCEERRKAAQRA